MIVQNEQGNKGTPMIDPPQIATPDVTLSRLRTTQLNKYGESLIRGVQAHLLSNPAT